MKRLFTILAAVLLAASIWAQSPQEMSYQAVIRNSLDQLVTAHAVGMRISILQGSSSGTVVYTETQTPTTNANGLVSIEIGGGAGFSTIDWANGSFFIKTETDPAGGTNYTITGTSQILSVPYALHAKTADSVSFTNGISLPYSFGPDPDFVGSKGNYIGFGHPGVSEDFIGYKNNTFYLKDSPGGGDISDPNVVVGGKMGIGIETPIEELEVDGNIDIHNHTLKNLSNPVNAQDAATKAYVDAIGTITETDPIYTSSEAANITATDITNLGNLSGSNTGDQDGSETKVTAGTNITVTGSGTTGNPYVVNATGASTLAIGDSYLGGIIFYLDASGQHGLIAATTDQSTGVVWTNTAFQATVSNAVRDGINGGLANTERIILQAGAGSYAAQLCANYKSGNYADWYLPSKYELNLLYLKKDVVAGFANNNYWSSTETSSNGASGQLFGSGSQTIGSKNYPSYVRAIRAF